MLTSNYADADIVSFLGDNLIVEGPLAETHAVMGYFTLRWQKSKTQIIRRLHHCQINPMTPPTTATAIEMRQPTLLSATTR
jgi:hypothetical protein